LTYLPSRNVSKYDRNTKFRRYRGTIQRLNAEGWKYLEQKGYDAKKIEFEEETGTQVSMVDATCAAEYALNQYWSNFTKRELAQLYLNYSSATFDN